MHTKVDRAFSIYMVLTALCCVVHFANHLGPANFKSAPWWLGVGVIVAAFSVMAHASLRHFLVLAGLQVFHVMADAPFNPDHWLLLFFVNVVILCSAFTVWLGNGSVSASRLYEQFVPSGRLIFLVCYGFAALCKFNTHFLGTASSCATELAEIQIYVSPWLKYMAWPAIAGWLTVICESFVWLLLWPPSTRRYGILLGILFHTALVISPAIAVFDFTIIVYTMLFLFTPVEFAERLHTRFNALRESLPAVFRWLGFGKLPILLTIGLCLIGRSAAGLGLYENPFVSHLNWLANLTLACTVIYLTTFTLFPDERSTRNEAFFRPKHLLHCVIVLIVVLNGLCPYLGLKTQGSFTMFSNLRTEAGHWNHLIMPRAMRIFSGFQDDLLQIAKIDDKRIQRDFVDDQYLVPIFEVQRTAAHNPEMALTIVKDGHELQLDPIAIDSRLSKPPSWITRKLMIFRPVTADGSPYCGN